MFHWLQKGKIYEWTNHPTATGLRFKVEDIKEVQDATGFRRVYCLKYLNYKFFPRPKSVQIGCSFISVNSDKLMEVHA